ncbi:DUF3027 domain-containing protein [Actinomadura rupiterrae]|uniref:DUF3027 domain-containing protein n=1 Tax=Actinomadura rupiterrae TaxID=559627 RepID=UPI003558E40B|nr:hypothetical protein [Actinomadura rupiterrae]
MSPTRQSSTARSTGSRSGAATAGAAAGGTRRSRPPAVDEACAEAVELARDAAAQTAAPLGVGEHLGLVAEAERVVTHYFACLDPGYRGWRWAVTVARASRARNVTVDECVLLPGDDALLAPAWVPWLERLRPGDIGPGDLMPTAPDDARLAPGYTETADPEVREVQWELGLGRPRVLSAEGRDEAAERWYEGVAGPRAPIATSAPAHCATCGFYVTLAGGLRQLFGVCANEYAPDDGRVVSADHGCGAHSDAVTLPAASEHGPPVLDELDFEVVTDTPSEGEVAEAEGEAPAVEATKTAVRKGRATTKTEAPSETVSDEPEAPAAKTTKGRTRKTAKATADEAASDEAKVPARKTAARKPRATSKRAAAKPESSQDEAPGDTPKDGAVEDGATGGEAQAEAAESTGTKAKATRTRTRRASTAKSTPAEDGAPEGGTTRRRASATKAAAADGDEPEAGATRRRTSAAKRSASDAGAAEGESGEAAPARTRKARATAESGGSGGRTRKTRAAAEGGTGTSGRTRARKRAETGDAPDAGAAENGDEG